MRSFGTFLLEDQLLEVTSSYESEIKSIDERLKESIKESLRVILTEQWVFSGETETE